MVIHDEEHNRILAPEGKFITNDGKEFVLTHYLSTTDNTDDWWTITEEEYQRILAEENSDEHYEDIIE